MRRIAIVGCSGGGKSTLALALGNRLGLPVTHLDTLFWRPGWSPTPLAEFRPKVDAAAAADAWIIEGNFVDASQRRFERADTVVWIALPRGVCLWRALWRMLSAYGRVRADLAPGCPERFDLEFYHYIWLWNAVTRPRIAAALAAFAPGARRVDISSDAEMAAFLADPMIGA